MGKPQSKIVEKQETTIVVPVNSPHLGEDNYETHVIHSGTLRATGVILIFSIMSFIICAVAIKRICKHMKRVTSLPAVTIMSQQAQAASKSNKNIFPDI